MRRTTWLVAAVFAAAVAAAPAAAQEGVSVSGGVLMPIGSLANNAGTGFALTLRDEGPLPWWQLDYRVDVGIEHFPGKSGGQATEYSSFVFNVEHWPSKILYDFGGPGLFNPRSGRNGYGTILGLQGGVGLVADVRYLPFVEFGVSNLFTGKEQTPWFSVRGGAHF